ncbi:MAG: hypothetical protein M3340_18850 [Actinomycetota bacterium]|nr:hypothetical protein [Actinomycetota bacterium]
MTTPEEVERVREVLDRHRDELMERHRAVGIGIGAETPPDRGAAIVVYLRSADDLPAESVEVESVRVRFEVTGPIRPLEG